MGDMFKPAPEPKTELGRYRVLSSTAGVRVSPLQLGAMSIGSAWEGILGSMNKEQSFKLLDAYYEAGGNFIDTANNYQDEQSEKWIGEWMKARDNRDMIVLASKFTSGYRSYELGKGKTVNFTGNHKKSLHMSVRDSLKKLQTDYLDILYLHWWDWSTSIEEVMDSLHILVQQGKVLYLGISDTPAFIVSACNAYAKATGKTQFSMYQGRWNVMLRDMEAEIVPMCRHWGMALCPWDAIGGGKFQSKKQMEERNKSGEGVRSLAGAGQSENEAKMSEALEKVAKEQGIDSLTAIALAWIMAKAPYVFPIIGGRKVEHLNDNIKALSIKLTDKQIEYLESVQPFQQRFPQTFVGEDPHVTGQSQPMLQSGAKLSWVQGPKAIDHA